MKWSLNTHKHTLNNNSNNDNNNDNKIILGNNFISQVFVDLLCVFCQGQVPYSNSMAPTELHQPQESPTPQQMYQNRNQVQLNAYRSPEPTTMSDQPSPPIARSSPIGSPATLTGYQTAAAQEQEYETHEFRLSSFQPDSQEVQDVQTVPSPHPSPVESGVRKCWTLSPTTPRIPPPFTPPQPFAVTSSGLEAMGNGSFSSPQPCSEIEVTPQRKGMSMFVGEDTALGNEVKVNFWFCFGIIFTSGIPRCTLY